MHAVKPLPEQAELQKILDYDPETGTFTWLSSGKRACRPHANRYIAVRFPGTYFWAHRLAWVYVHGSIPDGYVIDHINGDPSDNRLANLRIGTRVQNGGNLKRRSDNTSGFKGVHRRKENQWHAQMTLKGKRVHLGYFDTKEAANEAYKRAAELVRGEFAFHLSRPE